MHIVSLKVIAGPETNSMPPNNSPGMERRTQLTGARILHRSASKSSVLPRSSLPLAHAQAVTFLFWFVIFGKAPSPNQRSWHFSLCMIVYVGIDGLGNEANDGKKTSHFSHTITSRSNIQIRSECRVINPRSISFPLLSSPLLCPRLYLVN